MPRSKDRAARAKRRRAREQARNAELDQLLTELARAAAPLPAPDFGGMPGEVTPERFVREFAYFPAKDPGDLPPEATTRIDPMSGATLVAGGLNECQESYLAERSAFRVDEQGRLSSGADVVMKARQIYLTSLIMALTIWALVRYPGIRAILFVHVGVDDTRTELRDRALGVLSNLPTGWADVDSAPGSLVIRLANGSSYSFSLAGRSERQAEAQGRSKAVHIAHFADAGFFVYGAKLHSSVKGAMPHKGGIRVAEGTPGWRDGWHTQEYLATDKGTGSFERAHFWPWYHFAAKRILAGTDRYSQVMSDDFGSMMPPEELDRERALGIDDEQIAWRRDAFFTGTLEERIERRRENPEDLASCFPPVDDPYFDQGAIARARALTATKPIWARRLTPRLTVKVWSDPSPDAAIVFGQDQAAKKPKANRDNDRSATVAIERESWNVLATIHGNADPDEHAAGVQLLIERWQLKPGQYVAAADVTQDFGLTREQAKLGIRQWRTGKARGKYGVTIGAGNRREIIGLLALFIEGEAPPYGPSAACPDPALVDEFSTLVDRGAKIEHAPGAFDDLVMALGIGLYVARRWRPAIRVAPRLRREPGRTAEAQSRGARRDRALR